MEKILEGILKILKEITLAALVKKEISHARAVVFTLAQNAEELNLEKVDLTPLDLKKAAVVVDALCDLGEEVYPVCRFTSQIIEGIGVSTLKETLKEFSETTSAQEEEEFFTDSAVNRRLIEKIQRLDEIGKAKEVEENDEEG